MAVDGRRTQGKKAGSERDSKFDREAAKQAIAAMVNDYLERENPMQDRRHWDTWLSEQVAVTRMTINRVRKAQVLPDATTCRNLARVMRMPAEGLLELAGYGVVEAEALQPEIKTPPDHRNPTIRLNSNSSLSSPKLAAFNFLSEEVSEDVLEAAIAALQAALEARRNRKDGEALPLTEAEDQQRPPFARPRASNID